MSLRSRILPFVALCLTVWRLMTPGHAAAVELSLPEPLPPHPRLFANADRWAALRAQVQADAGSRQIFARVQAAAVRLLTTPPVAYVDTGAFWHAPMRQAQGRILSLAMTYRLTGDPCFLARAKVEMETLAGLPHWYPQHFLDTAEGALGLALGLDWLHDALSAEERDRFARALVEKSLQPSLRVADEQTWVGGVNNWTAVCHGGLVVAALAVAEREPALARQIVARALQNLPRYAANYAPAGAYAEGPDYWAYGTTFFALTVDALRTALGTTAGLEQAPGFLQTADYRMQMTAPSGRLYNFADNGSDPGFEPVLFWFARELHRPDLLERELAGLDLLGGDLSSDAPRDDASRLLPLALIWRVTAQTVLSPPARPLAWWSQGGPQPQAVLRSAWEDPKATYVALKGGSADASHAHLDIGSFILEAEGVRWAVDLGRESYPHVRANGLTNSELFSTRPDSRRWSIFRCGPESHNLLRFADAPYLVGPKAEISPLPSAVGPPGFEVDLTPVVRGTVVAAHRRFSLEPQGRVLIRDEWQTGDRATAVTWQWLTFARTSATADGFVLQQSGKILRLRATSSAALTCVVEDASQPQQRFDSPNPGLSRLVIRLATPAHSAGWLSVLAEPESADPDNK